MLEEQARLDGNAAGGLLREVFVEDLTGASGTCAHCGATMALGSAHLYTRAPGAVLRCPTCEHVLLRIVAAADRLLLDPSGICRVELRRGDTVAP